MELLAAALAAIARSPGFPEMAHLPTLALKTFAKASPVDRFRVQAKRLLEAIDATVQAVGRRRDGVDFAPKDMDRVEAFIRCARALRSAAPGHLAV